MVADVVGGGVEVVDKLMVNSADKLAASVATCCPHVCAVAITVDAHGRVFAVERNWCANTNAGVVKIGVIDGLIDVSCGGCFC